MRPDWTAKIVAAGLCLLVAGLAEAASTQINSTGVSLWRGSSKISDAQNRVVDPATGALTALTAENCPGIRDRIIQRDALTRTTGTATYRCQVDLRSVVTFIANPTCPALPPPDARVVDCPAGTGAYTQTRSYSAAPYPTCSTAGQWVPTEPPAGSCTPIVAEQWTFCSNEYQTCSFTGTRRVRFGLNTSWVERDLAAVGGGVPCRLATFGTDPVVGVTKRCELRALSTEPEPTGTATLNWQHVTPPAIAGFRIVHGVDPTALAETIQISDPGLRSHTVPNLSPGNRCFAVKAYDATDVESLMSNVVCRVIM